MGWGTDGGTGEASLKRDKTEGRQGMPAFYAHYSFGQKVEALLPDDLMSLVEKNRNLYEIGLHGPDILFFYHPLRRHSVGKQGVAIHHEKGSVFFEKAAKTIHEAGDREEMMAYAVGAVCHLALDAACHPFIERYVKQSGISHHEIEKELEKYLMYRDGLDPFHFRFEKYAATEMTCAKAIAPFYDLTPVQIKQCLESFVWYSRQFFTSDRLKRAVYFAGMRIVGCYGEVRGFFANKRDNELCAISSRYLEQQLEENVPVAVSMIEDFDRFCQTGSPLSAWFDRSFS